MTRKMAVMLCSVAIIHCAEAPVEGQGNDVESELNRAAMLVQHGLVQDGKRAYVDLLFGDSADSTKAVCLYKLGLVALAENKLDVALNTWQLLVDEFPDSREGMEVAGKMDALKLGMREVSDGRVNNQLAETFLDNAEFYDSRLRDRKWQIDTSYLGDASMANYWYERVIELFPGSDEAEIAYARQFKTFVGTNSGDGHGFRSYVYGEFTHEEIASLHVNLMVECLERYENQFSDGLFLQPMRYQVAQSFWLMHAVWGKQAHKDESMEWLKKVVDGGLGDGDFYVHLAKERLENFDK